MPSPEAPSTLRLRPNDRVGVLDASGSPAGLLPWLASAVAEAAGCELLFGWVLDPQTRPDDFRAARMSAIMGGPVLHRALADGTVAYRPYRFSQLAKAFAGPLRRDVMLIQARPVPGGFALAGTASWGIAAARSARMVVAEVNVGAPAIGAPVIPADEVSVLVESDRPLLDLPPTEPSLVEEAVATHVLPFLPLPCSLQYGPGGAPAAVVRRLAGQTVTLRSGILNEAAGPLLASGHVGRASATTVISPSWFYADAAAAGAELLGVERCHDIAALSATPRFVALNAALNVDLTGAVNVERAGTALVGSVGGHADFSLAATLSDGGLSIVALPSRRRDQPTIVPRLEVPTTTSRLDIDVVVTEHGAADLRGLDERSRAEALIRVADPADQDALWRALPPQDR